MRVPAAQERRLILLLALAACGGPSEIEGPRVEVDFDGDGFYAAPFPSAHRDRTSHIDLSGLPNPRRVELVQTIRTIAANASGGFGRTSGVFFTTTAEPAALPTLAESVEAGASVFLAPVDDLDARIPLYVEFHADGGPHGAPNLLSLVPLQGVPLRAGALHVAVVTRDAFAGVAADTVAILEGVRPDGLEEAAMDDYARAAEAVEAALGEDRVAALAVYRTADPAAEMLAAVESSLARGVPTIEDLALIETYDDFCVFEGRTSMPVYQAGEPPYRTDGGWVFDEGGALVEQRRTDARVFVTLPRAPMPAGGYPGVVFIRTGGGGDRPLIDRGVRAVEGGPAIEAGSGPARNFARAGYAGISVDGPHGGPFRNPRGSDEQLLVFNFENMVALRDNLRQSALEIVLVRHMLDSLTITSTCGGASIDARFDDDHVSLFGHSMGATIAPLALAATPRFEAAILSGAGGSWIENILLKQRPLPTKPLAELLLEYGDAGASLSRADPVLSLVQWAGEAADPPIYAGHITSDVLMFQGIEDTYILPPIANALSLALGADAAGPALEPTLTEVLPFSGRGAIDLPASDNRGDRTVVVVQHAQDPIEDGHEVVFQLEAPKYQYRCFLESLAAGGPPVVPAAGGELDACP